MTLKSRTVHDSLPRDRRVNDWLRSTPFARIDNAIIGRLSICGPLSSDQRSIRTAHSRSTARIFRKLGARSRAELAATLHSSPSL